MLPLVEWIRDKKGTPLLFELNSAANLLHLEEILDTAEELPCSALVLTSGSNADWNLVLDDLRESEATVLLPTGIGTLPYTAVRFNLAGELARAGCQIVLLPRGESRSTLEEFRTQVADLVRAGLPRDEALRAVTLRPAQLLGIDKRLGSIEKGKEADMVFFDADPLDPHAKVTRVMSHGKIVWEAKR